VLLAGLGNDGFCFSGKSAFVAGRIQGRDHIEVGLAARHSTILIPGIRHAVGNFDIALAGNRASVHVVTRSRGAASCNRRHPGQRDAMRRCLVGASGDHAKNKRYQQDQRSGSHRSYLARRVMPLNAGIYGDFHILQCWSKRS